jgi:hypothetical protein
MISKSLYQRLARLEEQAVSEDELKVWQIISVDSDGSRTLGHQIEMPSCGRRRAAKSPQLRRRTR